MMAIGLFVFGLRTAAPQQLTRKTSQRWATANRTGNRPVYQYTGPGEDIVTLNGVIYPEIAPGGQVSIELLRILADQGMPHTVVSGDGFIYGKWIITDISETQTLFFKDGAARKIEFNLTIKRADNNTADLKTTAEGIGTHTASRVLNKVL